MTGARSRRPLTAAPLAAFAAALIAAGCGAGGDGSAGLQVASIPLATGTRVTATARSCDRGANAYCSLQLVVVGPGYASSTALMRAEKVRLRGAGWTDSNGDADKERSAESPHNRLRLSLAQAFDDLESWDLDSLSRRPSIARALSATVFARVPALSLMLQTGSS